MFVIVLIASTAICFIVAEGLNFLQFREEIKKEAIQRKSN